MQIINRRKQPRHATRFQDDTVKRPVGLFPALDISGIFACAIMGLCHIKNFRCQMRGSLAKCQNFEGRPHLSNFAYLGTGT